MSASAISHSSEQQMTLSDGSTVSKTTFESTIEKLSQIANKGWEGDFILFELAKKCGRKGDEYNLFSSVIEVIRKSINTEILSVSNAEKTLKEFQLLHEDGSIDPDIQKVALNAIKVHQITMDFSDPRLLRARL